MRNQISVRQLCVAAFTGLLSLSAAAAWVDWRGALLAVPVVLLAIWAAACAGERSGGLLNGRGGKLLSTIYIVWGVVVAGTTLALCGERMSEAGGQGGPFWPTVLAAAPVLWLAMGKPEAFARAAEIFYLAMLAVLVFVFLLGAGQVEPHWLTARGTNLWRSTLTAAGLGCTGVYAVILWNGKGKGEMGRVLRWTAAGSLALAGMAALTVGSLSPALANAVERPFFVMTVGMSRTARIEALIALLWLVSDVVLLGLLLQSCRGMWQDVLELQGEKSVGVGLTAAALGMALWLERLGRAQELLRQVLPVGGLLLGLAAPLLLWALNVKRGVEERQDQYFGAQGGYGEAYLVHGKEEEKTWEKSEKKA